MCFSIPSLSLLSPRPFSLTASAMPPAASPPLFPLLRRSLLKPYPALTVLSPTGFPASLPLVNYLGTPPLASLPFTKCTMRDSRPKNAECRDWGGTKPEWGRSEKAKKKKKKETKSTEQESPLPPPALTI